MRDEIFRRLQEALHEDYGLEDLYARRAKGLTQTRLAEMAGINRETLGKIENTLTPAPNLETMLKLAYVLGMTPEELFSGKEKE